MSNVKTFYPKTPVEFSSSVLASLDSSTESNYTRQQYVDQYVEGEVHKRLNAVERDKLTQLDSKLDKALLKTPDSKPSVKSVNGDLDRAYTRLKALNEFKPERSPEVVSAEQSVVSCLTKNGSTPLNCWEEVEQFKKAASGQ